MTTQPEKPERPPVWVGHVLLPTPDLAGTAAFMQKLGLRPIADGEDFAVLELRGGTHLLLRRSEEPASGAAYFDLMVEDLAATHARLTSLGLAPTPIVKSPVHECFTVKSPSGHVILFNSTHVSDQPV